MKHAIIWLVLVLSAVSGFAQESKPVTKQQAIEAFQEYYVGMKMILSVHGDLLGSSPSDGDDKEIEIPKHRLEDYKAARKRLEKSVALNSYFPDAYLLLANSYWEIENDLEKTVEYYNKALEIAPDYEEVISARGYVYTLMGKRDLALRDLKKLEELKSSYADGLKEHIGDVDKTCK